MFAAWCHHVDTKGINFAAAGGGWRAEDLRIDPGRSAAASNPEAPSDVLPESPGSQTFRTEVTSK